MPRWHLSLPIKNLSTALLTQDKIQGRWSDRKNCNKYLLNKLIPQILNQAKWQNKHTEGEMLNLQKKT